MTSYLIDGYNFLFRIPTKKGSLEQKRESLIDILNEELSSFKNPFSIIFDSEGQMRDFAEKKILEHLHVIYAPKGKTADDYIIELVEINKQPKNITVVTSDTGLAKACIHLGAKHQTIEDFIAFLMKKNKKKTPPKPNYEDPPKEMERLLKIFEDKLNPNH